MVINCVEGVFVAKTKSRSGRKKTVKKRVKQKPAGLKKSPAINPQSRQIDEIMSALSNKHGKPDLVGGAKSALESMVEQFRVLGEFGKVTVSDEEIALKLVALYFREVARLGFKRSLEIDDVINSYVYALGRVRRRDFESKEIMDVIRRAKSY